MSGRFGKDAKKPDYDFSTAAGQKRMMEENRPGSSGYVDPNRRVDLQKKGDYGADPLGNGKFRMVPSGDIVDFEERNRRLKK
jgi:hypothetical protein